MASFFSDIIRKRQENEGRYRHFDTIYKALVVPFRYLQSQRNEGADRAMRSDIYLRHFVSDRVAVAETLVDGNHALKWDEIAQEKGPGEHVRPQSTSTQCPSMRERISHAQST